MKLNADSSKSNELKMRLNEVVFNLIILSTPTIAKRTINVVSVWFA